MYLNSATIQCMTYLYHSHPTFKEGLGRKGSHFDKTLFDVFVLWHIEAVL